MSLSHADRCEEKRVLVVDDDELSRYVVARRLRRWGFEPILFERPREALRYLRDGDACALISDLHMPESDGLTLARAVKELRPSLPILLMTASPDAGLTSRARAAGVTELVLKQAGADKALRTALLRVLAAPQRQADTGQALAQELRAPLKALKSAIELLCRAELPESQRRLAAAARRNVDQMLVLVERLHEDVATSS